ncbi:hypothetical protein L6164_030225 [Bauhinia variegata]|uniref:Uncharacterized protein n=1 Tax=Bauhinia variegata TaxID=167791 RepID=A0ACB9LC16_BAUVA|nr:hypothetical protein L6164_030225 [Bauhinia variegata]
MEQLSLWNIINTHAQSVLTMKVCNCMRWYILNDHIDVLMNIILCLCLLYIHLISIHASGLEPSFSSRFFFFMESKILFISLSINFALLFVHKNMHVPCDCKFPH